MVLHLPSEEEAFLKKTDDSMCKTSYYACGSIQSLNVNSYTEVCDMSDIDILITNKEPEADVKEKIEQNQVRLIVTDFDKGEETQ